MSTVDRPNFVLFMPETLRADAVLGDPRTRAHTPNVDRLAEQGVAFTHCYAQVSYCSPSRCSMFTGHYPHTRGHRSLMSLLHAHHGNLFRDLKRAGYRTAAFGKNDLLAQDAISQALDEVTLRVQREDPAHRPAPWPVGHRFHGTFYNGCRPTRDVHDFDWACIQSALQFLDEDHDRPFCLFLPLGFAHPPYEVEEPFFSMHDRANLPAPIPRKTGPTRTHMRIRHNGFNCDHLDEQGLREIKACYFGMVSRVDHQLGRVLDKLQQRGLHDRTVVVVLSDHGDYTGDYGLVEKFLAGFEDCLLRVPLVMRVPGLGPQPPRHALCEMVDLYPTLLELAGVEPAHDHFGRSLLPLCRGGSAERRDAVFAEGGFHAHETRFLPILGEDNPYTDMVRNLNAHPRLARRALMVRTLTHKYVYCPGDLDELYDLRSDPNELVNLADDPAHQSRRAELCERLLRWMLDTGDVLPRELDQRSW